MIFKFKGIYLGDLVFALYHLENLGRQRNTLTYVSFPSKYSQLLDVFKFRYLNCRLEDLSRKTVFPQGFLDYGKQCPKNHKIYFINKLLHYLKDLYDYDTTSCYALDIKFKSDEMSNKVAIQFDSRTAEKWGTLLSKELQLYFISKIKEDYVIVGGGDTKKYLGDGFVYQLGDIKLLSKTISQSKYFVGADSGMSHLAGAMGKRIKVYICAAYCLRCIKRCYDTYVGFECLNSFGL